jgi:predicted nuclease of predicted toxin-antitoxin system
VTRLLLDMGLAQSTGARLRSLGHDVVHLLDHGLERLSDESVVRKAEEEERVIVTHDLDFARIIALSGSRVPSVVTLRLADMTPASVEAALVPVLRDAARDLASGALVAISDAGYRVRALPLSTG